MNRNKSKFDKYKVTTMSTKTACVNVYMDSFPIEKVRFQAMLYDKSLPKEQRSINCYLDFEEMACLAEDCKSGRIFKKIQEAGKGGLVISRGGSTKSKKYEGGIESRIISLGMTGEGDNAKVYVNLASGKGKTNATGLIMPDGAPDVKISVGLTPAAFRGKMLLANEEKCAYLAHMVNALVREAIAERENGTLNTELEDGPSEGTIITED